MSDVDPDAVSEAPIVEAIEGIVLEVHTDDNHEYMPGLAIHLLSSMGDRWVQTVLIGPAMLVRLRDSVAPMLLEYLDSHTQEGP